MNDRSAAGVNETASISGQSWGSLPERPVRKFLRTCARCGGSVETEDGKTEVCVKYGMRAMTERCCQNERRIRRVPR